MELRQGHFWIPGYENRYACAIESPSRVNVFSYVYPGYRGSATGLCRNASGKWALTKEGRGWDKYTYSDAELISKVKSSQWFQKVIHKTGSMTGTVSDSVVAGTWIIGSIANGSISLSSTPKQHPTQEAA